MLPTCVGRAQCLFQQKTLSHAWPKHEKSSLRVCSGDGGASLSKSWSDDTSDLPQASQLSSPDDHVKG